MVKMYPKVYIGVIDIIFFELGKISVDAEGRDVYERVKQAGKYRYMLFPTIPILTM